MNSRPVANSIIRLARSIYSTGSFNSIRGAIIWSPFVWSSWDTPHWSHVKNSRKTASRRPCCRRWVAGGGRCVSCTDLPFTVWYVPMYMGGGHIVFHAGVCMQSDHRNTRLRPLIHKPRSSFQLHLHINIQIGRWGHREEKAFLQQPHLARRTGKCIHIPYVVSYKEILSL